MQKREWNKRPTYTYETDSTIPSNYYPVTSAITMIDTAQNLQFTVLNDRAQGGTVHPDTSTVELMMTRRILENGPEINEPLAENGTYGLGN